MESATVEVPDQGGAQPDAEEWSRLQRAAEQLGPGWVPLRLLAGGELPHPYALMREETGFALIGRDPDANAVARLRERLEAAGLAGQFGGLPPIVYRLLPPPELSLAEVVEAAFALEPPPALRTQDGLWSDAVQRILTSPLAERGATTAATPMLPPRLTRPLPVQPALIQPMPLQPVSIQPATPAPPAVLPPPKPPTPAEVLAPRPPKPLAPAPAPQPVPEPSRGGIPWLLIAAALLAASAAGLWYAVQQDLPFAAEILRLLPEPLRARLRG